MYVYMHARTHTHTHTNWGKSSYIYMCVYHIYIYIYICNTHMELSYQFFPQLLHFYEFYCEVLPKYALQTPSTRECLQAGADSGDTLLSHCGHGSEVRCSLYLPSSCMSLQRKWNVQKFSQPQAFFLFLPFILSLSFLDPVNTHTHTHIKLLHLHLLHQVAERREGTATWTQVLAACCFLLKV